MKLQTNGVKLSRRRALLITCHHLLGSWDLQVAAVSKSLVEHGESQLTRLLIFLGRFGRLEVDI